MGQKIKIGIPKAFLYYKYRVLWEHFFKTLGFEIVVSPNTNKLIFDVGNNCSIDENCTSAKIFMGHVDWLIGKCDYIFIPRHASYYGGDITCTKFHAIYDIARATFEDAKLLCCNIDYANGNTARVEAQHLGRELKVGAWKADKAYREGLKKLINYENNLEEKQNEKLKSSKMKVLIVAHPYNIYDDLIGKPIVKALEDLDVDILYSDVPNSNAMCEKSKLITNSLYWRYNKEIIGSIAHYRTHLDGIIFLTTFPCGPDSLVVELIMRKIKDIPMTNIIVDASNGDAGLQTRIESFIDILSAKKHRSEVANG